MSDIEIKLEQIATVINQIDDPKVPRNIRKGAKESCGNWLLNSKEMDVRIAMTQNKLEELYEDSNIPPEFETLILMINTELEKLLRINVIPSSVNIIFNFSRSSSSESILPFRLSSNRNTLFNRCRHNKVNSFCLALPRCKIILIAEIPEILVTSVGDSQSLL